MYPRLTLIYRLLGGYCVQHGAEIKPRDTTECRITTEKHTSHVTPRIIKDTSTLVFLSGNFA